MNNLQDNTWHQRFSGSEYYYGEEANDFLKAASTHIPADSSVISLGEGEGRNSVFLAEQGYQVTAVDIALSGLKKTTELAAKRGVEVATIHADLGAYELSKGAWGAAVNVFCHMPKANRTHLHQQIKKGLQSGGVFICECYSTDQLGFGTGGPKDINLLYTVEELQQDFAELEILHLAKVEREFHEGQGHTGMASVVQLIARKP